MNKASDENNMFKILRMLISKFKLVGLINQRLLGKALDQAYAEGYLDCIRHQKNKNMHNEEKVKEKIDSFWEGL